MVRRSCEFPKMLSQSGETMTLKRLAVPCALGLFACGLTAGCHSAAWRPHSSMETLSEAPEDHYHRVDSTLDRERRAMAEDLDLLFLTERPTRLSKWHGK